MAADTPHTQPQVHRRSSSSQKHERLKVVYIALSGNPSQSYGASLAVWGHTVIPATRTGEWALP